MSLESLLTQTVTVLDRSEGAVDDYGNPVVTFSSGTDYLARLEQTAGTEITSGRETLVADWTLYLPPDAEIHGGSRVLADGVTFEVIGPPAKQRTPRGVHHIQANLRHVEGG